MKKKVWFLISFSVFHVAAVLLFAAGSFLFVRGLYNLYGIRESVSLEDLSIDTLKKGIYVEDDLYSLKGIYSDDGLGATFQGSSVTQSTWGQKWYRTYTVKMGKETEEYITVVVLDAIEQSAEFERLTEQETYVPLKLFGKLVKNTYDINETWYKEAFGIQDEKKLKEMLSYDFCIKAVDKKKESALWYKGLSLMATGAFLWFIGSRKKGKAFVFDVVKGD